MPTGLERRTRAAEVATEWSDANILTVPYKKGPIGATAFALGRDRDSGAVRVWPGDSNVDIVAQSKKFNQIVVHMYEPSRSIKLRTKLHSWGKGERQDSWAGADESYRKNRIRQSLNVRIPGMRVRSYKPVSIIKHSVSDRNGLDTADVPYVNHFEVSIYAPKHESFFLIGKDELTSFICELPEAATSIKGAHDSLRPDNLREGFKRQGEWFFEPATTKELKAIEKYLRGGRAMKVDGLYESGTPTSWQRTNESHKGLCVKIEKEVFATGPIIDVRQKHHSILMLSNWHRVRANKELSSGLTAVTVWD